MARASTCPSPRPHAPRCVCRLNLTTGKLTFHTLAQGGGISLWLMTRDTAEVKVLPEGGCGCVGERCGFKDGTHTTRRAR